MPEELLEPTALAEVLEELDEPLLPPIQLVRLDGGYSWQTYKVIDSQAKTVILRLAPRGGTMEPYDPKVEARTITAVTGSVPVPPVLLVEQSPQRLGAAFSVHGELPGETVRPTAQVTAQERDLYQQAFCKTLGRIHAVPNETSMTVTDAIRSELETSYDHYKRTTPWAHPGFEIGYRWLVSRIPVSDDPAVLCHGDYRLANLLWTAPGELSGVLDWERAWLGDPMSDVAFSRLFSGWCSVSGNAIKTYENEAGLQVDEARVEYAIRFERWRSFTSSIRGMRAFLDGRNNDPRLLGIGLAGDAGAWELAEWLEPDLPALTDDLVPATNVPYIPVDWLAEQMPDLLDRLRSADERSLSESLEAMKAEAQSIPGLSAEMMDRDPESAWDAAFIFLAEAARTGGSELIPAIRSLALRSARRPQIRAADLQQ